MTTTLVNASSRSRTLAAARGSPRSISTMTLVSRRALPGTRVNLLASVLDGLRDRNCVRLGE